ncbi:MAG: TonB-dependent receptor [Sphingomicrobium sp.]|nr:TonB-dependent receptor [Sphingomonadales bacterium]
MSTLTATVRFLLGGAAVVAIASPGFAQTTSEDVAQATNAPAPTPTAEPEPDAIIVTATKRASTLQNVPFSINAQTQADLQRANAVTIEDVSRNIAGLAVQNLGPGQSQVSVRGVSAGQIVRDQPGVKEQVGVYLDESVVSLSLFTPDFDLFDLNRVETLRGPQGTLFGSGSVGGTIRYITNQPKLGRTEGLVEANVNLVQEDALGGWLKGAVNLPLGPTAAVRLVGYGTRYGGFIDAIGPEGKKNVNSGSRIGGRASILWEPAPGIKLTPRIVYQDIKANGFNREEVFNVYSNAFTTPAHTFATDEQYLKLREAFRDKTALADLTASAALGESLEVTSVTSYIHRNIFVSRDASALTGSVSIDLGYPAAGVNLPSNLVDRTKLKQFTQELRVGSTGKGPFQWVLGGFYSDVDRAYTQRLPTPGYDAFTDATLGAGTSAAVANGFPADSPYNSDIPYKIKQKAVFGEASYDFGQFKLTGGGRYYNFNERRRFVSGGLFANGDNRSDTTKSNGFSPRAIATWKPNANFALNIQASKGFRLGGVNDPLNLPLCTAQDRTIFGGYQTYKDETLWNYEAGVKAQAHGLTFNAAAFRSDIRNLQVTLDAGSCSSRVVFNVPKAHSQGVEAELSARPMRGLDLSLAGSVLDSKFDTTVRDGTGAVLGGIRDGNRLPTVPRFQIAATATYGQRFGRNADWYVSASYQHVGTRFTQPSDQENNPRTFISGLPFNGATGTGATVLDLKLPAYDLVDVSAGLKFGGGTEVVLYAKNLFDETPLLSFDRERGGRARLGFNVGQPRNIGITVRQAF